MLQTQLLGMLPEGGSDAWTAPVPPTREEVLPELRPSMKPGELISEILKTNPGVFLGDEHGSSAIPEFLSNSMSSFRDSGVKRLYVEMFNSDHQPMLDRFWEQGDNRQDLVAHLEMNGWNKAEGWPERVVSMLESAKKAGIRPIGIDTAHTGSSRLETANPHWVSVIQAHEAEASDRGLYVVWGGSGHSANFPRNKGVDWRLGIPSVDLGDSASISVPEVTTADGRSSDFRVTLPMHSGGQPNP
ncbi:MAG: hypothetical protein IPK13_11960 [Deltaproteobacteria bacterium]|nr:hypothetical protein [Deltaproteobacteria bacterium]